MRSNSDFVSSFGASPQLLSEHLQRQFEYFEACMQEARATNEQRLQAIMARVGPSRIFPLGWSSARVGHSLR